jgi:hypothetical protein
MANLRDVLKVVSPILGAAGVFDKGNDSLKMVGAEEVMPRGPVGQAVQKVQGMKKGGSVSSASKRADGIAVKGKTRGRMV